MLRKLKVPIDHCLYLSYHRKILCQKQRRILQYTFEIRLYSGKKYIQHLLNLQLNNSIASTLKTSLQKWWQTFCHSYTFVIKLCTKNTMANIYFTDNLFCNSYHQKTWFQKQRQAQQYIHFCIKNLFW
jgi:hypothetical protein